MSPPSPPSTGPYEAVRGTRVGEGPVEHAVLREEPVVVVARRLGGNIRGRLKREPTHHLPRAVHVARSRSLDIDVSFLKHRQEAVAKHDPGGYERSAIES